MKRRSLIAAAAATCLLAFVMAGCHKNTETRPDSSQQDQQKKETTTQQQPKDSQKVTEKQIDGKIDSSDKDKAQYVESKENPFADVHFDYDKYDVKESDRPLLQSVAAWSSKNSAARLSVEGHCDERGTNEYNLALGDRRAKAVRDYLVSLGVPSSRIDMISYGEEKPLCREQTEDCWAKNRRAHFTILVKAGK